MRPFNFVGNCILIAGWLVAFERSYAAGAPEFELRISTKATITIGYELPISLELVNRGDEATVADLSVQPPPTVQVYIKDRDAKAFSPIAAPV